MCPCARSEPLPHRAPPPGDGAPTAGLLAVRILGAVFGGLWALALLADSLGSAGSGTRLAE